MKKITTLGFALMIISSSLFAQDEGRAVAQERFKYNKSVYFGGGLSVPFGNNIGDYNLGINIEAGFLKRMNKVLSIGGSFNFSFFTYDPELESTENYNIYFNNTFDAAWIAFVEGGDLSLISLAANFKFNLIPVGDDTKVTIYGFAKPFLTLAYRTAVYGTGEYWVYDGDWYYDSQESWGPETPGLEVLGEDSEVTGGIFIGPGVEFIPAKRVSFFAQASFGYTFPLTFVSTVAYPPTMDEGYLDPEFPLTKKGFPSLSIQLGIAINF